MTEKQFEAIVEAIDAFRDFTLLKKSEEYASDNDRMHNFKMLAQLKHTSATDVTNTLMLKNLLSYQDRAAEGEVTKEFVMEKIGDTINYLYLLMAQELEKFSTSDDPERMENPSHWYDLLGMQDVRTGRYEAILEDSET